MKISKELKSEIETDRAKVEKILNKLAADVTVTASVQTIDFTSSKKEYSRSQIRLEIGKGQEEQVWASIGHDAYDEILYMGFTIDSNHGLAYVKPLGLQRKLKK
jgi:hypothetical protein